MVLEKIIPPRKSPPKRDLTGQRIGGVVCLEFMGSRSYLHKSKHTSSGTSKTSVPLWKVQCDCGQIKEIGVKLKHINENKLCCGCKSTASIGKRKLQRAIGMKFGTRKIIDSFIEDHGFRDKRRIYIAKCKCGAITKRPLNYFQSLKECYRCRDRGKKLKKEEYPEILSLLKLYTPYAIAEMLGVTYGNLNKYLNAQKKRVKKNE